MNKELLGGLMQKAQQMQENIEKAKAELSATEVQGEAGAGMVKIIVNCANEVKKVEIDPSILSDKEMLEDLIAAAFGDAQRKIKKISEEKMASIGSSLGIPPGVLPPGFKLPF